MEGKKQVPLTCHMGTSSTISIALKMKTWDRIYKQKQKCECKFVAIANLLLLLPLAIGIYKSKGKAFAKAILLFATILLHFPEANIFAICD